MTDYSKDKLLSRLDSPRIVFIFVTIMFLLFVSPYIIKGWDVWINQFDNLDQISYIGIFDGAFRGQFTPSDDMPENFLPGMEPIFRVSILSVQKLFWQFGFFPGFVINEMVYRILGFIGFYLLLRRLFMRDMPRIFPAILALSYSFLPFWPQGGLSIAGLPLLTWTLLLIVNKERLPLAYFLIVLYTLYSGFFLTGIFVIMALFVITMLMMIRRKPFWRLAIPMILMTAIYVAVYYSFFVIVFIEKIPTNRSQILLASENLVKILNEFFLAFFTKSHLHAHSYQKYLLLPVSIIGLIAMFRRRDYPWRWLMFLLAGFILFCATIFSLYRYQPFNDFYASLNFGFDYSRFYFLTPPVWYMMAGITVAFFIGTLRWKRTVTIICLTLLLAQLGINYSKSSWKAWVKKPSLREVMSTEQFDRITSFLEENEPGFSKESSRIGCVGFAPAIANFNGFKTLGAYCPSYPLHLKDDFLEILAGDMEKNKILKQYMEKWGSQLYLFDHRIFINMIDQRALRKRYPFTTCEWNLEILREKGVDLLFSTTPITNAREAGLTPVAKDVDDYYHFYIYRL